MAASALLLVLLPLMAWLAVSRRGPSSAQAAASPENLDADNKAEENPDARCAGCHAAIYASYERTAMARGSGSALQGMIPGGFTDASSAVRYQVFERDGAAWMSYARPASARQGALAGEHRLRSFVGSGKHGRTFLYEEQGLWFELPINFYTRRKAWDMAPNYGGSAVLPAPLPVDANCLHCHATGVAEVDGSARNGFRGEPFAQGGIGCNACHGDPAQHLATAGRAGITNPAKLDAERRDSACIQCHLEGDAVVYRARRRLAQFAPGDKLSDIALYFVRASQASGGARASSQYEALLQSACKRAAGDALTCTTCHEPHRDPPPGERVAFFRARCLACHNDPKLAATHHPEQPSCAACHMPSRDTTDISHEQVTDHNIQRRPGPQGTRAAAGEELVPVGAAAASDRDLGLAYAQMAQRGDRVAGERALTLLARAEHAAAAPQAGQAPQAGVNDEQLALNLGFLYQLSGHTAQAREEYRRALRLRPGEAAALSNLAVLEAAEGRTPQAMALLETLLASDPSQTAAGLNLARLQCGLRQAGDARNTAKRLAVLNPDAPALRAFLRDGCPAAGTAAPR